MNVSPYRSSCKVPNDYSAALRTSYLIKKRLIDITISVVIILTLFPFLFPLIILLIKLDSKGPIFFKQKRLGFKGKVFVCYKFRTMYVNELADIKAAVAADIRITKMGSFLRRTCLDELPQFLNVLLGDMSIVGPRPQMLLEADNFSNMIPGYHSRTLVRPGITGLSQVTGFRGPINNSHDIYYRYYLDMYYVRSLTLRLDLWIMVKTGLMMARSMSNPKRISSRPITARKGTRFCL